MMTDSLRQLAARATPGPWLHEGWSEKVSDSAVMYPNTEKPDADEPDDWLLLCEVNSADDAAFIAACSPDRILALLDELDAVTEDRDRVRGFFENEAMLHAATGADLDAALAARVKDLVQQRQEARDGESLMTGYRDELQKMLRSAFCPNCGATLFGPLAPLDTDTPTCGYEWVDGLSSVNDGKRRCGLPKGHTSGQHTQRLLDTDKEPT